jgi:hypothetical protein
MGLTAIAIFAPGDIITSSWANVLRTNFGVLDARTGGDPGAAGKIPVSDGATSSIWTVGLTAILALLGFTPVNKAGDTMTGTAPGVAVGASGVNVSGVGGVNVIGGPIQGGDVSAGGDLNVKGLNAGLDGMTSMGPMAVAAIGATNGAFSGDLGANGNLGILGAGTINGPVGGLRFLAAVADGVTAPYNANAAQAAVVCPNVRAASAVVADSATSATVATSATQANVALGVADGAIATTAKLADSIVTSAKIVDGTIVDGDVAAANKDGASATPSLRTLGTGAAQAAAGNHGHTTSANGTYTGNGGGSRVISSALGFSPKLVIVTHSALTATMIRDNNFRAVVDAGSTNLIGVGSCDANGFTVPSTLNANTVAYTWSAFG